MKEICLITGGATGFGLELVKYFKEKMRVIVLDITKPNVLEKDVTYFFCDVCSPESLHPLSAKIASEGDKIDLLINNVGLFVEKNFRETDYQEWQKIIHTNLDSAFLVTKSFMENLAESACIINISSSLAVIPEPNAIAYSTSKAALNMFTRCLSLEIAPKRVVAIAPGPIQLGETEKCPLKEKYDYRLFNPMKRFASAEEVCNLVWFVYQNHYINGTILGIDGGEGAVGASWGILKKLVDSGKV